MKGDEDLDRSMESRAKTKMKERGRGRVLGKKPPNITKLSCLDNMESEVVIHVKWKSDDKAKKKNVSPADLEESEGTSADGTKRGSARLLAAALKQIEKVQ